MKRLIKPLSILIAACLTAGCTSESATRNVLKAVDVPLYTINVSGKLHNDIPFYFQPRGSEKVYIFNPETGGMFLLDVEAKKLNSVCRMLPFTSMEAVLQGFTVDEKAKKIRMHYGDSTVMFNMNGVRLSVIVYRGLSGSGHIYPTDKDYLPLFKNGKIYSAYFPRLEDGAANPAFTKEPIEAMVDMKTRKITLLQQTFPANYLKNYYPLGTQPRRMEIAENSHAYTFSQNDSVFIRNIETGELDVKFFGTRRKKKFQYIPYDRINTVNAGIFKEIAFTNPGYSLPDFLPLAGYAMRCYIFPSKAAKYGFDQSRIICTSEFEYVGEIPDNGAAPGHPVDSKNGILTMICRDGKLTIRKLSW